MLVHGPDSAWPAGAAADRRLGAWIAEMAIVSVESWPSHLWIRESDDDKDLREVKHQKKGQYRPEMYLR